MAIDYNDINDDLTEIMADLALTMTYLGVDYAVAYGAASDAVSLDIAGLDETGGLQCFIQLSQFTGVTPPATGSVVTINGTIYRVESYSDSPSGKSRQLQLVDADR